MDVRSPREVADQLEASIPNAELAFIPAAGHMASIEAPTAFNSEVRRFLRRLS